MSVEQHVDLVAQLTRANILVAQINVRDLALIQGIPHPSARIGISPGYPKPEPRHRRGMMRNVGQLIAAREFETELRSDLAQHSLDAGLRRYEPTSRRIRDLVLCEPLLRNLDIETREPVARLEQAFLSAVLQQVDRTRAVEMAARKRRLREQGQRGVPYAL